MLIIPEIQADWSVEVKFNWLFTRFILFEIEQGFKTLTSAEIGRIDQLLTFHENLENYEICEKLNKYKTTVLNV